jgi:hypothetical protein
LGIARRKRIPAGGEAGVRTVAYDGYATGCSEMRWPESSSKRTARWMLLDDEDAYRFRWLEPHLRTVFEEINSVMFRLTE